VDEIQTGLGRLGIWWGIEREGIVPDVMLVGKGLSGGVVPVAAAVATADAYAVLNRDPFLHSSTFAGSPLAMAAVCATLEAMEDEQIVARASLLGRIILDGIARIESLAPGGIVTEVRARGLLIGIEFASPGAAADFVLELLERRVIVNHSLNCHNVVRLTPPAVMSQADLEWLMDALESSANAVMLRASQEVS
jgi:putrescine aminotransferase